MNDEHILYDGITAEEALCQWWNGRFNESVPEDVRSWIRALIREEVARTRIKEQQLDNKALQKAHDGRRLCQTKIENIDESIQRIQRQMERLRKFITLNMELKQQHEYLYQLNKRQASLLNEQRELERFEEFEPINGRFQRINTLNRLIASERQRQKELAQEMELSEKTFRENEKELQAEREKTIDTEQNLSAAAIIMANTERLDATVLENKSGYEKVIGYLNKLEERNASLHKELEENTAEKESVQKEITELRLKLQTLNVHKQMIRQSDAIKIMLEEFHEVALKKDEIVREINEATQRQEERDEQLSRLFSQSQAIKDKIAAKEEEANRHRDSIAGLDSYTMQRRALEQQSRKLMLETCLSIWNSISTGYELIERNEKDIIQLRLHSDHVNNDIDKLEKELRQINKQLEQKNYELTLSISQNVIEMRGDLAEGKPCTVCGSTHHPWQGETIIEHNALISSLKSECESLRIEQVNKIQQLKDLKTELISTQTRMQDEEEQLGFLRERSMKDTNEWMKFHLLDPSFKECSPSTNREARATLIRLLIEKARVDAESAEKDLNALTFHLNAISNISTEIHKLQQQFSDLSNHLNETNTACQVMAGQVERLNIRLKSLNDDYKRRYDILDHAISIPGWVHVWKTAPDTIKTQIQDMREQSDAAEMKLTEAERKVTALEAKEDILKGSINQIITYTTLCEADANSIKDQAEKALNEKERLLPGGDGKVHYAQAQMAFDKQKELQSQAETLFADQRQKFLSISSKRDNVEKNIHNIEEFVADERRALDLWMRQYNASHPPVQMTELERVLTDDKDWSTTRDKVREVHIEQQTTQARVDYLRAQIISLQAEGLRPMADNGESERQLLQEQLDELRLQQRQLYKQMAQFDLQIHTHEQSSR